MNLTLDHFENNGFSLSKTERNTLQQSIDKPSQSQGPHSNLIFKFLGSSDFPCLNSNDMGQFHM